MGMCRSCHIISKGVSFQSCPKIGNFYLLLSQREQVACVSESTRVLSLVLAGEGENEDE